jgi:hypothetical protein
MAQNACRHRVEPVAAPKSRAGKLEPILPRPADPHTAALDIARYLITRGVPIFTARPVLSRGTWVPDGGPSGSGYWIPRGWQHTEADPVALDRWEPGTGLGAVMGHTCDGLDVDPRHGGRESLQDLPVPCVAGVQSTPSGGWHGLIAPLGAGSRDAVRPGIDIKSGRPDGGGRGFLWISPTVKLSKVTGQIAAYQWVRNPDLDGLAGDLSGAALAALIGRLQTPERPTRRISEEPVAGPDGRRGRYVAKATESETRRVGESKPGQRNRVLVRAAFSLGQLVGSGDLADDAARDALLDAASTAGLGEAEALRTIRSGLTAGAAHPRKRAS